MGGSRTTFVERSADRDAAVAVAAPVPRTAARRPRAVRTPTEEVSRMTRRRTEALTGSAIRLALATTTILALAACGAPTPPDPDPEPDLAITAIVPAIALPGQEVTIEGTGFADGQVVAFDGVEGAVVSLTPTSVVVRVPDAYGYPLVSVDDVGAERLLFVGSAYAGPTTLAGVQSALDDLAEGAALRLGAGTYAGTELVVDNRKLFGAGAASVLEATADVRVLARSGTVAVLAELGVDAFTVELGRGRLATASTEPAVSAGAIVIADVDIAATALTMAAGTHLDVALQGVGASLAALQLSGPGASVTITGGDLTADVMQLATLADVAIDGAALTTVAGALTMQASGSIGVRGSVLTSADAIVAFGLGDVTVADTSYASLGATVFQSDGGAVALSRTDLAAQSVVGVAQRGVTFEDVGADVTSDIVIQSMAGDVRVADASLTAQTALVLVAMQGSLQLGGTDLATAIGDVVLQALGAVVVTDASMQSANDIVIASPEAGEVVVEGSLLTSVGSLIVQGSGNAYAGANGTVRLQGNASLTAGATLAIVGGASDVVIAENGPLDGDQVVVLSAEAHVTLRDNQRIESANDVIVQAPGVGGRLTAVDTLFVANDGAGTIVLETPAGELTQSGNVFTGRRASRTTSDATIARSGARTIDVAIGQPARPHRRRTRRGRTAPARGALRRRVRVLHRAGGARPALGARRPRRPAPAGGARRRPVGRSRRRARGPAPGRPRRAQLRRRRRDRAAPAAHPTGARRPGAALPPAGRALARRAGLRERGGAALRHRRDATTTASRVLRRAVGGAGGASGPRRQRRMTCASARRTRRDRGRYSTSTGRPACTSVRSSTPPSSDSSQRE
jgi:hypothetical protein